MKPVDISVRNATPGLRRTCALAAVALVTSACTMIPKYDRPAMATASQYAVQGTGNVDGSSAKRSVDAAQLPWRDFYSDKSLQKVIALALENNRDLRVSTLNVAAAQAQFRIQRADLLPTLSADAGANVERYPQSISPTGSSETAHSYSVDGAVASYEVDLFGRVRSLSQAALQTYFSTIEARHAAQIALISSVANAWLTMQADANLRDLSNETLKSQREGYRITLATFRDGTGTMLDVTQAETSVRTAEADYAKYDRQARQDVNALTLLVGTTIPPALLATESFDEIRLNDSLDAGVPSELLTRRPDIAAAEAKLKAANADIGAARANFFPRIELTASGGTASASLRKLFDSGSAAWSFAPSITVPIFDYGRNSATLKVAKVERDIAVATYQKTVQAAFRDVSDALDGVSTFDDQERAQTLLVNASQRFYDLSQVQYREGTSAYLPVLVSQQSLFSAQQTLIQIQLAHANNTVSLYAALGGGWNSKGNDVSRNR